MKLYIVYTPRKNLNSHTYLDFNLINLLIALKFVFKGISIISFKIL